MNDSEKKELIARAEIMTDIDYSLILGVSEKKSRRFPWAAAAAVLLTFGAVFAVLRLAKPSIFYSAADPTRAPSVSTIAPEQPTSAPGPYEYEPVHPIWGEGAAPALPTHRPEGHYDRRCYYSQELLEDAIKGGTHRDENDALHGLSFYYLPEKLPDSAKHLYIEVTPFAVWVHYSLNGKSDVDDPSNTFLMGFNRGHGFESAKQSAKALIKNAHDAVMTEYEGIVIVDLSNACRYAFFDQDGLVFEMRVPPDYDNDTIKGLCSAVRMELPPPAEEEPLLVFRTEEEFFDALDDAVSENSVLYGLYGYYALIAPPDGMSISYLSVTKERVMLYYGKGDPDYLLFSYLRNVLPSQLYDLAWECEGCIKVSSADGIVIAEQELANGKGTTCFWAQGNECFSAFRAGGDKLSPEEAASLFRTGWASSKEE